MLTIVGVGPGDPELMTAKAIRALEESDAIALMDKGTVRSIVTPWIGDKPVIELKLPMSGTCVDWRAAHLGAARQISNWLERGLSVAYPVLGDPSLYASSGYLLELLKGRFPCRVIPGVPAMCAAAAAALVPLAQGREPLAVLPGLEEGQHLPAGNVVVMKAAPALERIAVQAQGRRAILARNLGLEDQYLGTLAGAPEGGSYFTTVLLGPRKGEA